jgi:hypothetical protein
MNANRREMSTEDGERKEYQKEREREREKGIPKREREREREKEPAFLHQSPTTSPAFPPYRTHAGET